MVDIVTPLTFLAAWSVLSIPAALLVGAVLSTSSRRHAERAEVVVIPVQRSRSAA